MISNAFGSIVSRIGVRRQLIRAPRHFNTLTHRVSLSFHDANYFHSNFSLCQSNHFYFENSRHFYSTEKLPKPEAHDAISELFPKPNISLNSLNTQLVNKFGTTYMSEVTYIKVKKGHECELTTKWPESQVFRARGPTKAAAKEGASLEALKWFYSRNFISEDCKIICNQTLVDNEDSLKNFGEEESMFPQPLQSLNAFNMQLRSRFGVPAMSSCTFRRGSKSHICDIVLKWPEVRLFRAESQKKMIASSKASQQALQWLFSNGFITEGSKVILKDLADIKNKVAVDFSQSIMNEIDCVLKEHSEQIEPILSSMKNTFFADSGKQEKVHPTLGIPFPSPEDLQLRNESLNLSVLQSLKVPRRVLPIDECKQNILDTISINRVTIVKGETGCGKTTRVPQYILDEAISQNKGAYCNIAVVQPRRLTTMQTAKFVAEERGENIGRGVGYSVKMASVLPTVIGGSITFLTGMKLAHKFTDNPSLEGISHVVLDEVHMRDVGTDLVMTLLRQAMELNENLRVVIMSATVDTSVFQSYFSCMGRVPVIEVSGRTFPVKMHFLDDLPQHVKSQANQKERNEEGQEENLAVDLHMVNKVVTWIHNEKPDGGILVFVSGWNDMTELKRRLSDKDDLLIIPVHSMFRDCSAAFSPAPYGQRKVILATNIAETSLTFPDIVYVIDCGVHKKPHRNLLSPGGWSSSKMSSEWITKANVLQRKGRAGRVQPGESFHLFTKDVFNDMEDYELPSIMSESLEYLTLSVKMVNPNVKAVELLKEFPTPPSSRDVKQAVYSLQKFSLLSYDDERPTSLATAVMKISTSLPSALALIYSTIFRCFDSTLSVIACLEAPLVLGSQGDNSPQVHRSLKMPHHSSSDHVAKGKLISSKIKFVNPHPSYHQAKALKSFLGKQVMSMSGGYLNQNFNEHENDQLTLGVLLNCFGSLMVKSYGSNLKAFLRERSGYPANIRSHSVNHKFADIEDTFFMYLSGHMAKGNHLSISDSSVMSPLSVLLFLPSKLKTTDIDTETILVQAWKRSPAHIAMPKEHYLRVEALRNVVRDVQQYFVSTEVLNQPDDNYALLCKFRKQLMQCIVNILTGNESKK